MKTISVTGATGYVGYFVTRELLQRGEQVRALRRAASNDSIFDARVEWVTGDLLDKIALVRLVDGADAVIHLAYQHIPGRFRGGEGSDLAGWLNANLHGSVCLLTAAREAQVPQFIFLSSRAVFSHTDAGRVLDEKHPVSPDTHYGAYKAAVENMLRSFAKVEGMQTTSVRATGVYGAVEPVEQSKWWELIQLALERDEVAINNLSGRGGTEVHGADVARSIAALLANPAAAPAIVHLSDLYVTQRQIMEIAYQCMGQSGLLPSQPAVPPSNMLVSRNLKQLGITLGGESSLHSTIAELVRHAQNHELLYSTGIS